MEGHSRECASWLHQDPGIHWINSKLIFPRCSPVLTCFLSAHVWKNVLRKQSFGTFQFRGWGITTLLLSHSLAFWPSNLGWGSLVVRAPRPIGLDFNAYLWRQQSKSLMIWGLDETAWNLCLKTLPMIKLKHLQRFYWSTSLHLWLEAGFNKAILLVPVVTGGSSKTYFNDVTFLQTC